MSVDIQPLSPAIGARVSGVDLSRSLDDSAFGAIRDAFNHHSVPSSAVQLRSPVAPDQRFTRGRPRGPGR